MVDNMGDGKGGMVGVGRRDGGTVSRKDGRAARREVQGDSLAARDVLLRYPHLSASDWRPQASLTGREEEILPTID